MIGAPLIGRGFFDKSGSYHSSCTVALSMLRTQALLTSCTLALSTSSDIIDVGYAGVVYAA